MPDSGYGYRYGYRPSAWVRKSDGRISGLCQTLARLSTMFDIPPNGCYLLAVRIQGRPPSFIGLIAAICVFSIFLDVSVNCACDLQMGSASASIVITDDDCDSGGDPRSGSCVPDCCCCAPSLAAGDPSFQFVPDMTAALNPARTGQTIAGIAPIPYHPPSPLL